MHLAPLTPLAPLDPDLVRLRRSIARCGEGLGPVASPGARRRRPLDAVADDASLVAAARAGDERAFAELFRRHRGAVWVVVADRVRDRHRVDDVVQETFLRALVRLGSLRDTSRFRPWLLQIARNAGIDELRRQRRGAVEVIDEEAVVAARADPSEVVELRQLASRVGSAIGGLSPRDRRALALSADRGYGPSDLAAALGVSPTTAKVVLHRARRRLLAAIA